MPLASSVTDIWKRFQGELFPGLVEEVGELHTNHRRLVAVLDMVGVEGFVGGRDTERSDVFTRLRGVCAEQAARADARGRRQGGVRGDDCRSRLTRFDRHRFSCEAGREGEAKRYRSEADVFTRLRRQFARAWTATRCSMICTTAPAVGSRKNVRRRRLSSHWRGYKRDVDRHRFS